ncbi:heavy metal translocating P-type ATPase [Paenibacillus mucilaginosus]|uniref:P-type Cu(+) transporter n=1 Tax=Paenibacillus mucilaginosus (strain KNP414) TaxID=1036673 RepID=F8FMS6_PAEMK|nr:heavy metal translocating P-type ATPase [Paenibacillus mucilaginosus]AEI44247.1 heavy metal translocating P-type ATPase [Paenibacillus mucilaginosus KNP414]MCG7216657.1 heavy metal translocating P-type ATPase [Paenibacillus mucilaginosus]WDM25651.1 copper-translocating P-type ATPase [Paenibacillus mucilaginosus]
MSSTTPSLASAQLTIDITGMTCAACAARIERAVGKLEGVEQVHVNLALNRASVTMDPVRTDGGTVIARIERLGFGAVPKREGARERSAREEVHASRRAFLAGAGALLPFLWAMAPHHAWTAALWVPPLLLNPWFQLALATPVQFVLGGPFYIRAWKALRAGGASMDVLIVLGSSAAYLYSHYRLFHTGGMPVAHGGGEHGYYFFDTSVMILTIVWLGKWLEAAAKRRTADSIALLRQLQPAEVTVLAEGRQISRRVGEIAAGETILIRPGEKVPLDGTVLEGRSEVDESAVTGESIPMEKGAGAPVMAGTLNGSGALTVQVTAPESSSTVARMVRMVEAAQESRAPIQRLADRVSGVFVPLIVLTALLTFGWWYFQGETGNAAGALEKAIAVLLIACPCALGLATPVSVLVGSGRAAQKGVLFKEGRTLEELQGTGVLLLDKTGTLTAGKPRLSGLYPAPGMTQSSLLRLMAAAGQASEHPLSRAVVREAQRRSLALPKAAAFEAVPGCGVRAEVDGCTVLLGSRRWLESLGVPLPHGDAQEQQWLGEGRQLLYAASAGRWLGLAALSDPLRPGARSAVRQLEAAGVKVILVTGDHEEAARRTAGQAGISRWYAGMRPEQKLELVRRLQREGRRVAVAGDGINDAPALAAADTGLAVGGGTDAALAAAGVHLHRGDLGGVAEAYRMSRRTMRVIYQNLLLSLGYNVLAIPLAVSGQLAPWMACTAMALSSVTVVCNALRLQRA